MPNKDTRNPGDGEGQYDFDEDTQEAIRLPKVTPEVTEHDEDDGADDADKKDAASAFDDQEIDIDEAEVIAESEGQPPGRKY